VSLVAGCSGKRGCYRVVYGRRGEEASGLLSEEECLVASEDVARYVDESNLAIVSGWKRVPSDLVRVVGKVARMVEESPERLVMEADEVELYEDYDKATGKWRFSGLYIGLVYGGTSVTVFVDAARNVTVEAERSVERGEEWGEALNVLDSGVGEKILSLLGLSG
jgi:cob(I)alamin adenosyltransferase